MVGCLDTRVHVHACSCACWAACLTCWWPYSRRKLPLLDWQEQGPVLCPSSQPSPPPSPCPHASRLWEKHCIQKRALGTFRQKVIIISRALERREVLWLALLLHQPHSLCIILAAASWALNKNRAAEPAAGGWGGGAGPTCHPPLPLGHTGA